jgi:N-methylhydantoinase B
MNKPDSLNQQQDTSAQGTLDSITTEVIGHRLAAACDEIFATLVKTAYSPNIKERRDCASGIFDADGNLVALAAICPIHLSSLMGLVETVLRHHGKDRLSPGDCFITNDPYIGGGSHLPDIAVLSPVFYQDELVAFITNIAHHSDVGGRVPGSESADCRTIFEEGVRIPLVRILKNYNVQEDTLSFICLNSRLPREREGDLRAQIAANWTGIERIKALLERFGRGTFEAGTRALFDYAERRTRAAIARLPDGTYEHEEFLDNDGVKDNLVPLRVKLTLSGERIKFDFSGTAPQVDGARNMPLNATLSTVYYAVKALTDPDLPPNSGYYRAIDVHVPEGTVLNTRPPAAVSDRVATANILGDLLFGAFAKADPGFAMAACGPYHGLIFSGADPRCDSYFVDYETFAGASGATSFQDGRDAVRVHVSGAPNLPVETVEKEYPLAVLCYELIPDSGGAGRFRGGLGTRRDVASLGRDVRVSGRGLRQSYPANGSFGGLAGALGSFLGNPETSEETILEGAFSNYPLGEGKVVRVETPAGGGFGSPLERDPERVADDVSNGKVSKAAARDVYGVVVCRGRRERAATERQRQSLGQRERSS